MLKPNFKIIVNDKDLTATIKANLISISFDDKDGKESDEISMVINGLYDAPSFGDKIVIYLGYEDDMYSVGEFRLQTVERNFKANTTEVRATAADFSNGKLKVKRSKTWENTTLFGIAKTIAKEQNLELKCCGDDANITSKLQDNISDIEFIYTLAYEFGFLAAVKNSTLIIAKKIDFGVSNAPKYEIDTKELYSLEINEAYRNVYQSVVLQWQDISSGAMRHLRAGSGEPSYNMRISQPKSDGEAYAKANAKLNELKKGGISGRCSLAGANIITGGSIAFKNTNSDIELKTFSITSVRHNLNSRGYSIEIEFEG